MTAADWRGVIRNIEKRIYLGVSLSVKGVRGTALVSYKLVVYFFFLLVIFFTHSTGGIEHRTGVFPSCPHRTNLGVIV